MATTSNATKKTRQLTKGQLPSSTVKRQTKTKPSKRTVKHTSGSKVATKRRVKKQKAITLKLRIGRHTLRLSVALSAQRTPLKKKRVRALKKSNLQLKKQNQASKGRRQFIQALSLVLIGLASSIYFGFQVFATPALQPTSGFGSVVANTVRTTNNTAEESLTLPASPAVRLQIPDIQLDTQVVTVGRNSDNTLEVPADYRVAGLYRFGPTPGELGPAVIAGHVSNIAGTGVFWRLHELQPGQIVNVMRADGSNAVFKVTKVKNYSQGAFPTDEVYGDIDHSGLRLITCGGTFNVLSQRYSENTVVFASFIPELSNGFTSEHGSKDR